MTKLDIVYCQICALIKTWFIQGIKKMEKQVDVLIIGGGVSGVSCALILGSAQYKEFALDKKIGIINFDAHFDLREAEHATSGTPFLQAARLSEQHQKQFNYLCIGVANHANTKVLFDTADALNCSYLRDHEVNIFNLPNVLAAVDAFIEKVDCLYVTIDLDVFAAAVAPGVSAPAVKGIDLATFEAIFKHIQETGKIKLLDIAECNPKFDLDNRTAKLAAYIVYQYLFS